MVVRASARLATSAVTGEPGARRVLREVLLRWPAAVTRRRRLPPRIERAARFTPLWEGVRRVGNPLVVSGSVPWSLEAAWEARNRAARRAAGGAFLTDLAAGVRVVPQIPGSAP